ncbi:hypothetical protein HN803_07780 [candidate division WWE3 bacterium]|jgi:hypothetical protein|nr:hypothetical protein [candidate division WWE3 bacterium]
MKKVQNYTNKVYRLKRDAAPLSFMLPTRHTRRFPLLWFDEEKGVQRALRYARNQKTPFEDEQDGNAILEPIIFEDGFLRVNKENQVLQKFLEYHPQNGIKFEEVDNSKKATKEVDVMMTQVDALVEAKNLSIEELETLTRVVFNRNPDSVSTQEMKRDMLVYARNNPQEFMSIVSDPILTLQAKVHKFFDEGFLKYRNKNKEVWYNTKTNKTKLCTIPYGEDSIFIVSSFFQSDDGIESLKHLENLLDK